MRFFLSLAVAALAAVASADNKANPFKIPTDGYTFKVGEPTTLSWKPTTSGTVSLYLKAGAVTTKGSGTPIASGIDNDGSYTWKVPSSLDAQPDYTIEIVSDEDENDYNFIGRFTVEGATVSVSSSTASSTSTSSTSTKTSESSTSATPTTESTTSSSSTTRSPTTMTTASSTSVTETSTTETSTTETSTTETSTTETSTTAVSTSASASGSATPSETQNAVPTTNAGIANRVSGGMLALVAGALML